MALGRMCCFQQVHNMGWVTGVEPSLEIDITAAHPSDYLTQIAVVQSGNLFNLITIAHNYANSNGLTCFHFLWPAATLKMRGLRFYSFEFEAQIG